MDSNAPRPDPRTRWGALILAGDEPQWLPAQLLSLAPLVSRILVVPGAQGEGFEFDPGEITLPTGGHEIRPDEGRTAAVRAALSAAGRGELFLRSGPQAEVLNAALSELGCHDVLVLGAGEFLDDPVEVLRACERAPRALCFGMEARWFHSRLDRVLPIEGRTLIACRPGQGFRFEGPRSGRLEAVDMLDACLSRYGASLLQGEAQGDASCVGEHWRNSHPAPVLAALGEKTASDEGPIDVSIVIPFYGEVAVTEACVRAILDHALPTGPRFEIILRDDAGPEHFPEEAAILADPRVRLSRAEENQGFLRTVNAAARQARGRYLLLLNNDTEPLAGWLDALVEAAESSPEVGVVGAQLLYPDGKLQEAGGIIYRDASGCNYGKFDDPSRDRYQYRREVDYVSGAALLIARRLWEELGGFDERFAPAYYEDTDLCFQVRKRGLRVIYEPRARVVHLEGHTCGTDESGGEKRHQVTNRTRFREKWAEVLDREHAPAGSDPHHARERAEGHILIVHPSFPMFDRDSGSFRLFHIVKALRASGKRVSFVSRCYLGNLSHRRALENLGVQTIVGRSHLEGDWPTRRCLGPRLVALSREYPIDVAILGHYHTTRRALRFLRRHSPGTRIVTDSVDVHYRRLQREADLTGSSAKAAEARKVRRRELAAYRKSDHVIAISEDEAALLRRELGRVPVSVLSNIHPLPGKRPGRDGRRDLLFIGSFNHPPNIDALNYLLGEVLPLLWKERPEFALDVIGGGERGDLDRFASPRVRFLGFVDDLEPHLDSHLALVAPLRFGAGAKGKVGQALSYGLPVITTAVGAEGMGLVPGEHYLHAESAVEFVAQITRLEQDEELWSRLAERGVERIREDYSEEAVARRLGESVLSLAPLPAGWRRTWTRVRGYANS